MKLILIRFICIVIDELMENFQTLKLCVGGRRGVGKTGYAVKSSIKVVKPGYLKNTLS
jgi:hypothetical protein